MKLISLLQLLLVCGSLICHMEAQEPLTTEFKWKGFNFFSTAVAHAGWEEKFRQAGPFTVFAPTDRAFRDLPRVEREALLNDKVRLATLISNHTVEGKIALGDLKPGKLKTLGGTELQLRSLDGKIKVGTGMLVKPDGHAANGVVHGIDAIQDLP